MRRRGLTLAAFTMAMVALIAGGASAGSFVTGVYGRDSSSTGVDTIRQTGFNTVTMSVNLGNIGSSLIEMDRMQARGMRVLVWLGSYDRAVRCDFERSDDWIRQVVGAIAHHPAIAAFQIGDEVDRATARGCPDVPSEIAARDAVIRSVAPTVDTYVTITAYDGIDWFPYQRYASTASILGLVIYPCPASKPTCNWARIDKAIQHADSDGVDRYWVVMQAFGDRTYRQPTAQELDEQMTRWRAARLEGYFVYHWKKGSLEAKPAHLDVLKRQNAYYLSR
jgi:hypothetical protein